MTTSNTPSLDRERLAQLRQHFVGIGFTEDGIRQAVGGTLPDPWSFATSELRADSSPLSAIAKLFYFGVPVERRHAETAFAPLSLADLQALGLVERFQPEARKKGKGTFYVGGDVEERPDLVGAPRGPLDRVVSGRRVDTDHRRRDEVSAAPHAAISSERTHDEAALPPDRVVPRRRER